jgi:hypothetical protein
MYRQPDIGPPRQPISNLMAVPHFVILGAQKSASTYLATVLNSHPGVYMPTYEVRFFEDPDYSPDLSALETMFRGKENKLLGIKRPDYLARAEVPARLQQHLPDVRLIALLREPVSRLVSAYYYYIKLGFLPPIEINRALPGILRRYPDLPPREKELLDYGCYGTQLERYRDRFGPEQLLVLIQDDMRDSVDASLNVVFDFLNLSRLASVPKTDRSNTGVYSIARLKWLRQRNRFFYNADSRTGNIAVNLTPFNLLFGGAITVVDRCLLAPFSENSPPKLEPSLAQSLRCFYADQVAAVERILGRTLGRWRC